MVSAVTVLSPPVTAHDRSSRFSTFLADQPEYLVPERLLADERSWKSTEPLVVSPDAWFTWRDQLPQTVEACYPLPHNFLLDTELIWVNDPVTHLQRPFWAGAWFQEKLAEAHQGVRTGNLSAHHGRVLFEAGVLVDRDQTAHRSAQWQQSLMQASGRLLSEEYARLLGLIHPFHLGSLRRYYRHMVRTGGNDPGRQLQPATLRRL